MIHDLILILMS